jgi:malate synthase
VLDDFVATELLDGLALTADEFWRHAAELFEDMTSRHTELLARRAELQNLVDDWHREHAGAGDTADYCRYLIDIGYLEPMRRAETIRPANVDPEIARVAGPQLVVPLSNARYTLNAANARWGSLYDALYGSDVIPESDGALRAADYNPVRGARVIAYTHDFLDRAVPLAEGGYGDVTGWKVTESVPHELVATISDDEVRLRDWSQFVGFRADGDRLVVLLRHHDLGVQLVVDPQHPIGRQHQAALADVVIESAITTIADCEDSVAAVDAEDKVEVYRNWLGLQTGGLEAEFEKGGHVRTRRLGADLRFTAPDGAECTVPGRSLLLVRNVGLHMTTDAVLTAKGDEVPEGILDALITVTAALHDLRAGGGPRNSPAGSIYVVKPKLHGSAEVQLTVDLLAQVETCLGLPEFTVKLGLMDEERRTSLNLDACIDAARDRLIFVNTGFLDRTGDEIHTLRAAGPVLRKDAMKDAMWFRAYEGRNVECGLAAGFAGRAQIGKGMWAAPDRMADMLEQKIAQPRAGASCGWVPSPTAATLHALHYHEVDVSAVQQRLAVRPVLDRGALLVLPLSPEPPALDAVLEEVRTNAQSILGYVTRWVEQGVGCSKVPDLLGVALMEDRATLRISCQHVANWLRHDVVDRDTVLAVFEEMAGIVDEQNADDPDCRLIGPELQDSAGYRAALDLVFDAIDAPNGYTERVLRSWRREVKARQRRASR